MEVAPNQLARRVAVLTHYLPPYIAHVFQYLVQSVPDTRILLSIPVEPNREYEQNFESLQVEVQKSWMIRRPWKHDSGFRDELYVHVPYDTLSRLRKMRPEIILSFELGFRSLASAMYRRTRSNCRMACCVCVSEHTEKGRGTARWLLRRTLVKLADAVTYNGPSCRVYLEQLGVPSEKLFHVPYAAQDQYRASENVGRTLEADKRLICVGQLIERKGVLPMLASLSEYCRQRPGQPVEITFVGSGPLLSAVRNYQAPSNLRIDIEGHVDPSQMPDLLRQHGILVFPTLADEWGLVVNEAMHTGMPVLGSEFAQACTTLIQEGANGWIYSPDRGQTLHDKLDQLYKLSPAQLHLMRTHAQQSVREITSKTVADKILGMFQQLSKTLANQRSFDQ